MINDENTLSAALRDAEHATLADRARKSDWAGKRIIQQKIIAAHILAELIPAYRGRTPEWVAVNGINRSAGDPELPVDPEADFGIVAGMATETLGPAGNRSMQDFRFGALTPGDDESTQEEILVSIDIQNVYWPGYPLANRMALYSADALKLQETGSEVDNYRNLKKAYTIWICTNPPKALANKIVSTESQWQWVGERSMRDDRPPLEPLRLPTVIIVGLGDPDSAEAGSLVRLLGLLLRSSKPLDEKLEILQTEYSLQLDTLKKVREEMAHMSTWFEEATLAAARELAGPMAQDMAQGLAQDMAQGLAETLAVPIAEKMTAAAVQKLVVSMVRAGELAPAIGAKRLGISVPEMLVLAS